MMSFFLSFGLASLLFFIGALHAYWALGGLWGFDSSLPTDKEGNRILNPGKFETWTVALGLIAFGMVYLDKSQLVNLSKFETILNYLRWIIPSIFILRAIGDFKYVGFFKKVKNTTFGKADSKLFSPLCLLTGLIGLLLELC